MKKRLTIIIAIALIICMAISIANRYDTPEEVVMSDVIKVGITMYSEYDPFTEEIRHNIEEYLNSYSSELGVDMSVEVVYSGKNQLVQNDQVEDFIDKDFDIVCVNIVDRTDPYVIIEKAKSSNTPIIFFNREIVEDDLKRYDKLYYVGAKPEQSGQMQGQIVIDALRKDFEDIDVSSDGVIQYVLLEGEAGHQDAIIRSRVAIETIKDSGIEMEMLGDEIANWDRQQAQTKMTSLLAGYPRQIELVIANDDNMALGALDALTDFGVQKLPLIVGVNGQEEVIDDINEGLINGTVLNNAKEKGRVIATLALDIATDNLSDSDIQLEDGKYYYVDYEPITIDNVQQFIN